MELLTVITLFLSFVLFFRIPHFDESVPDEENTLKALSVIIPARNEEKNILRLLDSLQPYRQRGYQYADVSGWPFIVNTRLEQKLCHWSNAD